MVFDISYNSFSGDTTISSNGSIIFAGSSKKHWFAEKWMFYEKDKLKDKLVAVVRLYSKWFSQSAMLKVAVDYHDLNDLIDIYYRSHFLFSYSIDTFWGNKKYIVYPHNDDKFSIFVDEIQIASLRKLNLNKFFTSDWQLKITDKADFRAVILLAYASFILGDKRFDRFGDYSDVNWVKESKKFDNNWDPNNS
ncbi:hypothetical protein ACFQ48_14025 [Hymenobacter caeli]|uniref:Uncharacterized protein n=1 Tax=Hymenobacter caeli TaxID=2735894 RepID=A0ABX2FTH0_9BACT|nr:hypothetical protein [Hymenobacter caeli]NRT20485.1 hypothetical protein [Hymenobacter caeli]